MSVNKNLYQKELTILHSNDIHGNFLPRERDGVLYGGAAKLHQYIENVREERKDKTLYVVAGDLFTGSTLDSESKGVFSVQIMNQLKPDVVTLGNHAADHSAGRILFFEKLADFDVINANIYMNGARLFRPYQEIMINGLKILIIGVVTPMILDRKHKDADLQHIDVRPPYEEIKGICEELGDKLQEYDLRIILSHIGHEEDKKLARELDKKWKINLIIGGHSHTEVTEQVIENDILIVQAGKKTKKVGRIDLKIDTKNKKIAEIVDYKLVPLNSQTIEKYGPTKSKVKKLDGKINAKLKNEYKIDPNTVLVTLPKTLLHENRYEESALGNFFADILLEEFNLADEKDRQDDTYCQDDTNRQEDADQKKEKKLDIATVGSGSIREEEMGPDVTFKALIETFNLNKIYFKIRMKGSDIKKAFCHYLAIAPYDKEAEGEYFQLSRGCEFHFVKDSSCEEGGKLTKAMLDGHEIEDDRIYSVGIEDYHYYNFEKRFNLSPDVIIGEVETLTDFMFGVAWKHLEKNRSRYEKTKASDYELKNRTKRD